MKQYLLVVLIFISPQGLCILIFFFCWEKGSKAAYSGLYLICSTSLSPLSSICITCMTQASCASSVLTARVIHRKFKIIDKHRGRNGLPWWLSRKESTCNAGVAGSIPGLRRFLWRRGWQSTPVFLPGKTDGQRSLVGYSLWGSKRVRHDFASKDIHTWRRKQYRNHPYSHHLKRQSGASSLPLEVHTPHTRTVSASQPVLPPSQTSLPLPSPVWVPLLSLPVSPVPSQLLPSSRQTSTS